MKSQAVGIETIKVLAVDDEPFNLELIELAFLEFSNVVLIKAVNGKDAIEKLRDNEIDVILLDLKMPVMDGFETLDYLKNNPTFFAIPVIIITANDEEKYKALKMGANDFLAKPIDIEELKLRIFNQATFYRERKWIEQINANLDKIVEERTKQLTTALKLAKETEYEIAFRLGIASEYRDLETGMHIKRMSCYSAHLGRLYGLDENEVELLSHASLLHDIGKIGIPDAILLKPGKLNEKEFEIMKQHTTIGGLMLKDSDKYPIMHMGQIIAMQHHEKYDGSGYPNALVGEEIHLFARIVAIADVFDALSSKRPYKDPFPLEKTIAIMKDGHGKHFDPNLLDLFFNHLEEFLEIQRAYPDTNENPHILNLLEEYR